MEVLGYEEYTEGPQVNQVANARIRLGGAEWRLFDSPPRPFIFFHGRDFHFRRLR